MGEYIKHRHLGEIKLGTCENLYYTTYQQYKEAFCKGLLSKVRGNDDPENYLKPDTYRFRFPFPDENIKMGYHDDFDRGVLFKVPRHLKIEIHHDTMQHRVSHPAGDIGFETPCIQSPDFPHKKYDWKKTGEYTIFEVKQQKPVIYEGRWELQTVVACPYCGSVSRLSKEEAEMLHTFADVCNEMDPDYFTDLQKQMIPLILAGYPSTLLMSQQLVKQIIDALDIDTWEQSPSQS